MGIGAVPNAVCSLLLHSGVRNLGVHTEMMTDGIVDLYKAGIVTGAAKTGAARQDGVQLRPGLTGHVRGRRPQPRYPVLIPKGFS